MIVTLMKIPAKLQLLLTLALLLVAALILLPTFFQHENALLIRTSHHGSNLPDGFYLYRALNNRGIHIKSITPQQGSLVIKLDSGEQSNAAEQVLRELLPGDFEITHQLNRPD